VSEFVREDGVCVCVYVCGVCRWSVCAGGSVECVREGGVSADG